MKGFLGLFKLRLIDPYEVFYDVPSNTFYPIVSKAGCTSVKKFLIEKYHPNFQIGFPEIHKVDPAELTDGKLERQMFFRKSAYIAFARGKQMKLIIRNPLHRFFSCYIDVRKGKNTLYEHPSGLDWLVKSDPNLTLQKFLDRVCATPDHLADRHFRSQSFFFPQAIKRGLHSFEISDIENTRLNNESDESQVGEVEKHNENKEKPSEQQVEFLKHHRGFQKRYKRDIELFKSIVEN
ncbi:MAG: sulfotransferase family 2 domain-containing protein [Cryomorphaceae bacterium]|nr:sulfotransferase family protein [Flavobacteriales bacterium]